MQFTGGCLCGSLTFQITSNSGKIYQCHCSLCRKSTGTNANANLVIKQENFIWTSATDCLKTYRDNNWSSAFCAHCGSKMPVPDQHKPIWYIPAGALNEDIGLQISQHIFVGSKAAWDNICDNLPQYEEYPSL